MRGPATALAALLISSCGYSSGLVLPETDDAVAVEFFGNDSLERDIEVELHDQLTGAFNRMVPAELVAPGKADLVLSGRVLDYSRRGGIRSPDNELLESGVRISVEARLVKRSPGQDGSAQEEEQGRGIYRSESGYRVEEPLGELRARDRVLRNIADRIVLDLFASLAYETEP